MNSELLMQITAAMPCKTIEVNGEPYLRRYFAGYADGGGQWWIHQFMSADAERHLHSHPFHATATVLCGGYTEEYRHYVAPALTTRRRYLSVGDTNQIYPTTLHRIVEVNPDTWTLLHVRPDREPTWKFIADDDSKTVVQSSPEDWHLAYGPRESGRGCE